MDVDVKEEERKGLNEWVDVNVEIPGFRDDDSMPVFLGAMLSEALLADGEFAGRLYINARFHWKIYLDVCFALTSIMYEANNYRFCYSHSRSRIHYHSSRSLHTWRSFQHAYQSSNQKAMKIHCSTTIGMLLYSFIHKTHIHGHRSHF